jgi:spermidine synthase
VPGETGLTCAAVRPDLRDPRLPLVGAAFFLSGAAALAYQVSWQRVLALQTGVGLYSVAVIVAAFMLGLGLGSHIGGVWSVRFRPEAALRIFALCELGIALFGAMSVPLYYDWLYFRLGWLYAEPVRGGLLHFAGLALPTALMGMSLPFLTRAMVRAPGTASGTIAFLYGVNTLGAATGALVTPWLFVRHFGIRSAVAAAVAANLVAAGIAVVLALRSRRGAAEADGLESSPVERGDAWIAPATAETPRPFKVWLTLYALSGFCALSLEIVWFRVLDVALKSTAYTFGTLLAAYLLGSATGSLAGIALVRTLRRPLRAFLLLQCVLLAYAAAAVAALVLIPENTPGYAWFYDLWGGRRSFNLGGALHWDAVLRLYVILPLALFGLPTVLMGLSYPVLQRAVQDDAATSGRKVGLLQAANIAGCVAGSLVVGLFALDRLGTTGTLRALLAIGVGFAVLGWRATASRRLFLALALALAVLGWVLPSQARLWLRLHGTTDSSTILGEDATGVAALIPSEGRWMVWAGGRRHSTLPFGGVHTVLGAAPAIVHPAPVDVAIIGLGSGDTAASAGCRRDVVQRITVFEIFEAEHRLLSALAAHPRAPARLGRFLRDSRFRHRIADGRNALEREDARYDLIEADALWPTSPYAGNLYSLEFFRLCASRLKSGGLVCTWTPTPRVRATFLRALPYVLELGDGKVLVGSRSPIAIDLPVWRKRLFTASSVAYLSPARVQEVWDALQRAAPVTAGAETDGVNEDLFPRDEFNTQ